MDRGGIVLICHSEPYPEGEESLYGLDEGSFGSSDSLRMTKGVRRDQGRRTPDEFDCGILYTYMQAWIARWRERLARPLFSGGNGYGLLALLGVVFVVGIFVVARPALAISMDDVINALLGVVGWILSMIIFFLGKMIIIVVNLLIGYAQYNNFVHSNAVTLGWPLVRDVVNMFFIVVILVSAFSTIIRYKEFHYTTVLPKLLLMAVLINFSKTLIGLLIDFSQVIMLTFVSAFAQAAGGNFMSALRLNEMTKLGENYKTGDPKNTELKELIVASMLAIVLMFVALILVIMMTVFLVLRIVILWILLILSPIAFFALALPGKMKTALSAFTSEWWKNLSTMLVAGPVMAFFLWLALAIAQGPADSFMEAVGNTPEAQKAVDDAASDGKTVNPIGKPSSLGAFMVAVVMMYLGVDFAKKTASAVPGMASSLGLLKAAPGFAARTSLSIARGTARTVGKGARAGFEGVDRLADVRGFIGRKGLAASAKLGGVGAATFAGMAGARGRRIAERREEISKQAAGLGTEDRLKFMQAKSKSLSGTTRNAVSMNMATIAASGLGMKALTKQEMAKVAGREDLSAEQKQALAEGQARNRAAELIKAGEDAALATGSDDVAEKLGDFKKKNISASPDIKGILGGAMASSGASKDYRTFMSSQMTDTFKDSLGTMAVLNASGIMGADGEVSEGSEQWRYLEQKGGERFALIQAQLANTTAEDRATMLKGMDAHASAEDVHAAVDLRGSVARDRETGNMGYVRLNLPAGVTQPAGGPSETVDQRRAREERIERAQARVQTIVARNPEAETSPDAQRARFDLLAAGGKISQAYDIDERAGTFENPDQRLMYDDMMSDIRNRSQAGDAASIQLVTNLDLGTVKARPNQYNEARSRMVTQFTPDMLSSLAQRAQTDNDQGLKKKIRDIMGVIDSEAKRVQKVIADAGVSAEDLERVAADPMSPASTATTRRLADAGHMEGTGMVEDAAHAIASSRRISQDEGFREIRGQRNERAQARANAARARTGRGGGGGANA